MLSIRDILKYRQMKKSNLANIIVTKANNQMTKYLMTKQRKLLKWEMVVY